MGHIVKVLSAGCLAPLLALVLAFAVIAVIAIAQGQFATLAAAPAFGGLLLIFIYPIMFFFGIPVYLLLRRVGWDNLWSAALLGFAAAFAVPFLLQLESGFEIANSGINPNIAYDNLNYLLADPVRALSWFDLLGVAVGVAFWWIVKYAPVPIDAPSP